MGIVQKLLLVWGISLDEDPVDQGPRLYLTRVIVLQDWGNDGQHPTKAHTWWQSWWGRNGVKTRHERVSSCHVESSGLYRGGESATAGNKSICMQWQVLPHRGQQWCQKEHQVFLDAQQKTLSDIIKTSSSTRHFYYSIWCNNIWRNVCTRADETASGCTLH